MAVVYFHRRGDNNQVFYVGVGDKKKRAYVKGGRNQYWKNIVKKHGYSVEIVNQDITFDEALELEKEYIKSFGRDTLTNMTDGGQGTLGLEPHNKGKSLTDQEKQVVSQRTKEGMADPQVKERIREGRKNYTYTTQHRENIGKANKRTGNKPPSWKGKNHKPESCEKISVARRGEGNGSSVLTLDQVKFIKKNYIKGSSEWGGTGLAKKLGVSKGTIYSVISGTNWSWVKV
jgi:hypothetical protein